MQYFSERREHRALQRDIGSSKQPGKKKRVEEEETPTGIDFSTYEYAIERTLLEAPTLELTYYVDVVGQVPPLPHADPFSRGDVIDVGNGGTAPEWGFDLVISGGTLKYGPWADRQRAELQRVFFPPTYQNVEVTERLKPGDNRLWTALNIFIELRDETTLQIPFREHSKVISSFTEFNRRINWYFRIGSGMECLIFQSGLSGERMLQSHCRLGTALPSTILCLW